MKNGWLTSCNGSKIDIKFCYDNKIYYAIQIFLITKTTRQFAGG